MAVPFDAPETVRARCGRERDLAERAVTRLQELVDAGPLDLESVSCSCRPGTHGTKACNHGRACGILSVGGRNVGDILIGEGLARPYHCGANSCLRRQWWCGVGTQGE